MQVNGLTIRRFVSAAHAARALAVDVAERLAHTPRLTIGLPTGRTPVPFYRELVRLYDQGRIDFSRASTFNIDEFLGLAGSDSRSYRAFMERHLFSKVNLAPGRVNFLNGVARDPEAECARFEWRIARSGGLDLVILGLGTNGHIGFNEPGDSLVSRTHVARLSPTTRLANATWFGERRDRVPRRALSMGMATILRARRIVLLATGRSKAAAVRRLVHGPLTSRVPASFLQVHPSAEVWVDEMASGEIGRSG